MFNPPHPGQILKEDVLPDLGLTISEAAQQLGVARVTLSRIANERASITLDMAIRPLGMTPKFWLNLQTSFDLKQTELGVGQKIEREIQPIQVSA